MSFQQNEEENTTTSTEETERPSPRNPERPQNNVLNVHLHVDKLLVQAHNQQNMTKIVHQPEQTNVPPGDQEDPSRAFNKLKKTTGELYDRKFDVDVARFNIPASNLPEVHPELLLIDFFEGRFIPNDDQYDPKTRQIKFKESDKKVSIDQLISRVKSQSFISIVGYPGAGKTTLSKRLARHLDGTRDFLVLGIPFMSMNDCDDEKLTLKELLLGDVKYKLKKEEKNVLFRWMENHTQDSFLIFDGFDQVNWNLMDKVKRSNYDTLLTCQELVSNLCRGTFLPNCHIVFTSRPHAMFTIPQMCRPKQTYFVRDLTSENMKKLFDVLINNEQKSSKIFNKLTVETPHLESMCHNPLMLQLYLRASLGSSHETANISTMTTIFHRVLENLKSSDHAVSLSDQIVISLSKLAFQATKNKTVLITFENLQTEHLTSEQVQALVVTLFGSNRRCGLLEGNRRLYFSHQTFQEFFSALYMVDQMSLENFTTFVQTNLLVDHWSVVVQFLSGMLLDPRMNEGFLKSTTIQSPSEESDVSTIQPASRQTRSSSPGEKRQKREVFIAELYEKTRKVAADHKDGHSITAISRILREGNDEEVTVAARRHFDGGWIRTGPSDTQNDIHAVTSFLKLMPGWIGKLDLSGCEMNSNQFLPWKEAIKSMHGSIDWMHLGGNFLSVHDVIEVMSKVEEYLGMWNCLDDGDGERRYVNMMERSMLKEALDRSGNKKLEIRVRREDVIIHKDRED